jgi:hypothetical protein
MAKAFEEYPVINLNFRTTINNLVKNTLTFENCTIFEKYKESQIKHYEDTELGLFYSRNIIMDKYGDFLIATAKTVIMDRDKELEYAYNPFLASFAEFGTSQYWWLVLYVNECITVDDFKDFKGMLKVPDIYKLRVKLKYELAQNEYFGTIVDEV